jgi:hypothetical protein
MLLREAWQMTYRGADWMPTCRQAHVSYKRTLCPSPVLLAHTTHDTQSTLLRHPQLSIYNKPTQAEQQKSAIMPRGNDQQTKVHYKGEHEDFIVFIESTKELEKWKGDKSVPLAQVVGGWKVFVTHKYVNAPP